MFLRMVYDPRCADTSIAYFWQTEPWLRWVSMTIKLFTNLIYGVYLQYTRSYQEKNDLAPTPWSRHLRCLSRIELRQKWTAVGIPTSSHLSTWARPLTRNAIAWYTIIMWTNWGNG